jgi:hypothetical protein
MLKINGKRLYDGCFKETLLSNRKKRTKEMQDKIDYKPSEEGTQTKSGRLHST